MDREEVKRRGRCFAFRIPLAVSCVILTTIPACATVPDDLGSQLDSIAAAAFPRDGAGGVVLVARHARPILRRAYGWADLELGVPMREDHVLKIASIAKQFTAIAVLQQVAAGRLALDDDVRTHVPDFDTHGRRITIEHLLTHTSGLPNLVDLERFDAIARQDYTVQALLALTRDKPLHFEPGMGYRYSDTGYILLGALIERLSGLRYGDYIETRIFRSVGMRDSYYADDARIIPRRARGYEVRDGHVVNAPYLSMTVPHAAGALASTVDDLLRWHISLRAGSVVPAALLEQAWRPRTLPDGTVSGYGFGWKICTLQGHRTIEHGGFINGFTANALQLPDDTLDVIVLVNNGSDAPDAGMLARRLARFALTRVAEPKYVALDGKQRAALVGSYRIGPETTRRVFEVDGQLHVQRNASPGRPVMALSRRELTPADSEGAFVLTFEFGPDGRAAGVRSSQRCEPVDAGMRILE